MREKENDVVVRRKGRAIHAQRISLAVEVFHLLPSPWFAALQFGDLSLKSAADVGMRWFALPLVPEILQPGFIGGRPG